MKIINIQNNTTSSINKIEWPKNTCTTAAKKPPQWLFIEFRRVIQIFPRNAKQILKI